MNHANPRDINCVLNAFDKTKLNVCDGTSSLLKMNTIHPTLNTYQHRKKLKMKNKRKKLIET